MPILEAMERNAPILASSLSIFREIVGDTIGYFALEGDSGSRSDALCEAMMCLPDRIDRDYTEILARYRSETLTSRFLTAVREVVEQNGK